MLLYLREKYCTGRVWMAPDCENCGKDLYVNPVDRPNVDWVKVVCSNCGHIKNISMIRLSAAAKTE
jgi:DNA-directed RNA polymerase subunit M/transcription elongation factor TFIIS